MQPCKFSMFNIKLLIVDDHGFFRRSLAQLLELEPTIQIVGTASSGDEAIAFCRAQSVDVVLMDLNMPYLSGLATIERIRPNQQALAILVLTGVDGMEAVQNAFAMGAQGFMRKDAITDELLISAIFTVANGGIFLDAITFAALRPVIIARNASQDKDLERNISLSSADLDLLRQIALGYDNNQIAQTLQITPKTVSNRLSQLYLTLKIQNRVQAANFALRTGLVDLKETL